MVRVCLSMLLPLVLLQACAIGQAPGPANPQLQASDAPASDASKKESALDCARKNSVLDAWTCATSGSTSP